MSADDMLKVNQTIFYTLASAASIVMLGAGMLTLWEMIGDRCRQWRERREQKARESWWKSRGGFSRN
jgi:hypothetical protein